MLNFNFTDRVIVMAPLTFSRLRLYNVLIGLFQLATGAAILALGPLDNPRTKLPWYTFFIASWSRDDDENPESAFYRCAACKALC